MFVPNYSFQLNSRYSAEKDTFLLIQKGESMIVGYDSKIDFPWGVKTSIENIQVFAEFNKLLLIRLFDTAALNQNGSTNVGVQY